MHVFGEIEKRPSVPRRLVASDIHIFPLSKKLIDTLMLVARMSSHCVGCFQATIKLDLIRGYRIMWCVDHILLPSSHTGFRVCLMYVDVGGMHVRSRYGNTAISLPNAFSRIGKEPRCGKTHCRLYVAEKRNRFTHIGRGQCV